jgi:hypothetical protein
MIYAESNFKDLVGLAASRLGVVDDIKFEVSGAPYKNRVVTSDLKVIVGERTAMHVSLLSYARSYREEDIAAAVAYIRPRLFSTALGLCDHVSVDSLFNPEAGPGPLAIFRYN